MDDSSDNALVVSAEETMFHNVFAGATHDHKPGTSKRPHGHSNKDQLSHHSISKMQFPMFDGTSPKIWIDNCCNYFTIYNITVLEGHGCRDASGRKCSQVVASIQAKPFCTYMEAFLFHYIGEVCVTPLVF